MTVKRNSYVAALVAIAIGVLSVVLMLYALHPAPKPAAPPAAGERVKVTGVEGNTAPAQDDCPDAAFDAVLHKIGPVLGDTPETLAGLAKYDVRIQCLREWAETLKDSCIRANYVRWLDFYDRESKRAASKIAEGRNPKETEYDLERKEERRRVAEYERTHVIPTPAPSCERSVIDRVKP